MKRQQQQIPSFNLPPVQYAGWYKIEAFKGIIDIHGNLLAEIPGTRRVCADWFTNLITDQGLDYIGNFSDYTSNCHVGTSSTAPANSDTGLFGFVAGTSNVTSKTNSAAQSSPYFGIETKVYRFGIGAAEGNLSEVGVGRTTVTGSLFSRALIVDGVGDPVTISVLSDEFLDVTFELRMYVPLVDVTGSVTLDGISRDYTIRAIAATDVAVWGDPIGGIAGGTYAAPGSGSPRANTGALVSITTGELSGQLGNPNTRVDDAYVNGNLFIDTEHGWDPGNSTDPAIRTIRFTSSVGSYQMEFLPVLNKTAVKAMTHKFRFSWARRP